MKHYHSSDIEPDKITHYKMSFDGCGIEYGLLGEIFGSGIDEQCQLVLNEIKRIREKLAESGQHKRIKVNGYGHSRGGVALLKLAKMLGHLPLDIVEVNLAMLDPVPGNLIVSGEMDFLELTLANQVKDLRECHNLRRVISLYPYVPLEDYTFHGPINPLYPPGTVVEEDVLLGCHSEVENIKSEFAKLAVPRFRQFMKKCGTMFSEENEPFLHTCKLTAKDYEYFSHQRKYFPPENQVTTRHCHSASKERSTLTYFGTTHYINRDHRLKNNQQNSQQPEIKPPVKTLDGKEILENLLSLTSTVYEKFQWKAEHSRHLFLLLSLHS